MDSPAQRSQGQEVAKSHPQMKNTGQMKNAEPKAPACAGIPMGNGRLTQRPRPASLLPPPPPWPRTLSLSVPVSRCSLCTGKSWLAEAGSQDPAQQTSGGLAPNVGGGSASSSRTPEEGMLLEQERLQTPGSQVKAGRNSVPGWVPPGQVEQGTEGGEGTGLCLAQPAD